MGTREAAAAELQTEALIRKRLNGWEILLLCRSSKGSDRTQDRVESDSGESGSMTVYASGLVERAGATSPEAAAGVRVREFEGEWRVSIAIPSEWIADSGTAQLLRVGFRRRVGDNWADAPTASAPWSARPITVTVDLKAWR